MKIQSSKARKEAKKEALLLKKLAKPSCYPSIICYYDSFIINDELYIEMEYIDGETLKSFVSKRKNDPNLLKHLLAIMADVLPGLIYLHSQGIIHRDIKPDNIMIDSNHQPKIIDVGLACDYRMDPCPEDCCLGGSGTPFYMAPETLLDRVSFISSDTWGLGATIYYLVTGKHVFEPRVQNISSLKKTTEENDPPILRSGNDVLDYVINSMLKKDHLARITENELLVFLGK